MENIEKFIEQCKRSFRSFSNLSESKRNEDVILWKDGSVTTNSYSGSVSYMDKNIVLVYTVSGQAATEYWRNLRPNSQMALAECDRRGWFSLYQGIESRPASQWENSDRFEPEDDTLNFIDDEVERLLEENGIEYETWQRRPY